MDGTPDSTSTPCALKASEHEQSFAPPKTRSGKLRSGKGVSGRSRTRLLLQAIALVVLAALCSPISQLTLSPVYGSTNSERFHLYGLRAALFLGWYTRLRRPNLLNPSIAWYLPVMASLLPLLQVLLERYSGTLGPVAGPILTEFLTYWPLAFASSSVLAHIFEIVGLCPGTAGFVGSYFAFHNLRLAATKLLGRYVGSCLALHRVPYQMIHTALYAASFPSRRLVLALLPLLLVPVGNIHAPFEAATARLNSSLAEDGYLLLGRRESITGYLSVLESKENDFKVMRCDQSLLGGEWTRFANAEFPAIKEPTFAVFVMLEAVRLVKSENDTSKRLDKGKNALVIGLGIGTTPIALAAHGINTTVVEIDPAVVDLAKEHFGIPAANLHIAIDDAISFVDDRLQLDDVAQRYDYIVHDVFTGGVEPSTLFTQSFLLNLRSLLKEDGIIAINYAGDLRLPPAGLIVRTILSVFPSCRLFREEEPSGDPISDLTNMVIFCKPSKSSLEFREAEEHDYLGSLQRKSYLYPQIEVDPAIFAVPGEGAQFLTEENMHILTAWHHQSAASHWHIMRNVLPAAVWEKW